MTDAAFAMPPRDHLLRRLLVIVFAAAVALCAGRAMAEDKPLPVAEAQPTEKPNDSVQQEQSGTGAHRRTVLRFGEDDINGNITKPDGELVQAPRKPSAPTLLRVRKNFLDRALSGVQSGQ